MNRKRLTILALLMVAVMLLSLTMLVACNNDDAPPANTETPEATEGLLITNGDFKLVGSGSTSYPRSITNWTGSKMYSSGSYEDDVIAGAINLARDVYNSNKSNWADARDEIYNMLTAGGRYGDDDEIKNALMIFMPEEGADIGDDDAKYGPTAYGYTSSSFTLKKGGYYKLSIDVLTYNISGVKDDDGNVTNEPGARIYVSSNTYAEFAGIDTQGEWKTYEIYFEAASTANNSLTLQLGLGKYTSTYSKGLTTGYAFFDNVELTQIEKEEDGTLPEQVYNDAKQAELANNEYIQTSTMKVPNGRFDFGTTTLSSSASASNWKVVTGNSSESDYAPKSAGWNGIIDASKFADNYKDYSKTYYLNQNGQVTPIVPANMLSEIGNFGNFANTRLDAQSSETVGRIGNNVYMLSQQLMTAQGLQSQKAITFEKNKIYALSVDIYTTGIFGEGVSLILTGSDGKDIAIKGISRNVSDGAFVGGTNVSTGQTGGGGNGNGGWTTYTFYIQGNQYRDYSYTMTMWLGTGGTNDNTSVTYSSYSSSSSTTATDATTYSANGTFSTGWAFFDELRLNEISSDRFVSIAGDGSEYEVDATNSRVNYAKVSLQSENAFKIATSVDSSGNVIGYNSNNNGISGDFSSSDSTGGYGGKTDGMPDGWEMVTDDEDTTRPVVSPDSANIGAVSIKTNSNTDFSQFGVDNPSTPYDIPYEGALMLHSSKDTVLEIKTSTFSVAPNSFYRISLWVKTLDVKSTSGIYVYLMNADGDAVVSSFTQINTDEFDESTGDWCELTFLVRGASVDVTDLYLKVTLGTGNRWAADTLASGAAFVTNMSMTAITYSNFTDTATGTYVKSANFATTFTNSFTNGSFDEYDLTDENLDENGLFFDYAGTPKNWSISDNTLKDDMNKDDRKLVAGTVKLDNKDLDGNGKIEDLETLYFKRSAQIQSLFGESIASKFDSLYGNDSNQTEYLENLRRLGGPSMLAISGLDSNKYAVGYQSDSFKLNSNTTYKLSVWVKTIGATTGSVYLSGEASATTYFAENPYFVIKSNGDAEWTEYVFYIEVGQTSVSLQLNLWLGRNSEIVSVEGATDEEKAENAKSSGLILFDSVALQTIDKESFDDVTDFNETERKLSFVTDGFDTLSETIDARSELTKPSNWTGTEDTGQDDDDVKSGIIYADGDFLETEDGYVSILGAELSLDKITVTTDDLYERFSEEYGREPDAATDADLLSSLEAQMKEETLEQQKQEQWMPINQLYAKSGKNMLIINNMAESAFYFAGTTFTMNSASYYKVSVWVRTYNVTETSGAYIELYLGSANESDAPLIFKAVQSDEWTQYTFYVETLDDNVTSVRLRLGLGKYYDDDNTDGTLAKGYAMFDDVAVTSVSAEEFNQAVEDEEGNDKLLTRTVSESASSGNTEEPGNTEVPSTGFNLDYLWWMIPTILLGLVIIIVLIVFAIKKFRKPKKAGAIDDASSSSEAIEEKRDKYDGNRE